MAYVPAAREFTRLCEPAPPGDRHATQRETETPNRQPGSGQGGAQVAAATTDHHQLRGRGSGDGRGASALAGPRRQAAEARPIDTVCPTHHDRPGDTFRGWLWMITRNKIRDHHRASVKVFEAKGGTDAQRRLMELPESEPHVQDTTSGIDKSKNLFLARLESVRAEFEQRTWDAFWRATIEEESTKDIAAELDMTVNAVRKAKCRVLRRLRDEFDELIQ